MRQAQSNRRGRGRSRKAQNPLTKNYESNGPDVKIRGTAAHISEKYTSLSRDALTSGDIVRGENYLQHAEHYNRIIAAAQQNNQNSNEKSDAQSEDNEDSNEAGEQAQQNQSNARQQGHSKSQDGRKNNRRRRNENKPPKSTDDQVNNSENRVAQHANGEAANGDGTSGAADSKEDKHPKVGRRSSQKPKAEDSKVEEFDSVASENSAPQITPEADDAAA